MTLGFSVLPIGKGRVEKNWFWQNFLIRTKKNNFSSPNKAGKYRRLWKVPKRKDIKMTSPPPIGCLTRLKMLARVVRWHSGGWPATTTTFSGQYFRHYFPFHPTISPPLFSFLIEGVLGSNNNLKKQENFSTMFEKSLIPPPPPPPIRCFRLIWKMLNPPLRPNSDILEFENILMVDDHPGLTS